MLKLATKCALVALVLFLIVPAVGYAKNSENFAKGKSRATHSSVSLSESSSSTDELRLSTVEITSDKKLETEIDLYPTIAIIRVDTTRPFYIFPRPKSANITLSGLIAGREYYLYKEKLSNPIIFTADTNGSYTLNLETPRHRYLILKTSPSTYHIDDTATGGDCPLIGTWNAATKTCTLSSTKTINQIIEIDDGGITLDGAGRVISHSDNMGIYANRDPIFDDSMANITIENVVVNTPTIGIALIDLPNGFVKNVTIENSTTGLSLKDDTNIEVTQNNFINNSDKDVSIENSSGILLSTSANRGNFWDKNTTCTQNLSNPNQCSNSYVDDAAPWACANAWLPGVTCPVVEPNPDPGTNALNDAAINNMRDILGAKYLWGGKGYDLAIQKFVEWRLVKDTGYSYWNPIDKEIQTDTGVDCSGLSMWGYDRASFGDTIVPFSTCVEDKKCPIAYEGADKQRKFNSTPITKEDLQPGDFLFFDTINDGVDYIDHMAIYIGGPTESNVIHSGGFANKVSYASYDPATEELTTIKLLGGIQKLKVTSYGRRIEPIVKMIAEMRSPAYFTITDPSGITSNIENQIGSTFEFQVRDTDNNGELNDVAITGVRETGDYIITVTPKPNAQPTDTYTLIIKAWINNSWTTLVLAEDVSISDIPKNPYMVRSSVDQITIVENPSKQSTICHIPPGNPQKAHNILVSESAIPAHLKHGDVKGSCDSKEAQSIINSNTKAKSK